ncbi:MAG: hypothetical protein JO323_13090 [Acidobacteriia bacterium]|nr:hypothetical protein [Terriglobia bacterium]
MQIRRDQMQAFDTLAQKAFRRRVGAYLRQHLPDRTKALNDVELETRVAECQEIAAGYGIDSERAIAKWSYLTFVVGVRFHKHVDIEPHLSRSDIDQNLKLDFLMRSLIFHLEAAERGKAGKWPG